MQRVDLYNVTPYDAIAIMDDYLHMGGMSMRDFKWKTRGTNYIGYDLCGDKVFNIYRNPFNSHFTIFIY